MDDITQPSLAQPVPNHTHDNINSPYVDPVNFCGPIISVADATVAPTDSARNGTTRYYYDTAKYVVWARVNNIWVGILLGSAVGTVYLSNPMTTAGDIIYGGASGTPTRLAIGGSNTVLHGGGSAPSYSAVVEGDISLTDVTTDNVSSTAHGFAPKSPADATKFLNGAATPAYAQVKDSDLSLTDITNNNVSTSAHGFAPKAPNDTTKFLRGDGTWAVPSTGSTKVTTIPGTTVYTNSSTSATDWIVISIPANTLGTSGAVRVRATIKWDNISGGGDTGGKDVILVYGSTTIAQDSLTGHAQGTPAYGFVEFTLISNGATNSQYGTFNLMSWPDELNVDITTGGINTSFVNFRGVGTAAEDSTGTLNFKIQISSSTNNSGTTVTAYNVIAEKIV